MAKTDAAAVHKFDSTTNMRIFGEVLVAISDIAVPKQDGVLGHVLVDNHDDYLVLVAADGVKMAVARYLNPIKGLQGVVGKRGLGTHVLYKPEDIRALGQYLQHTPRYTANDKIDDSSLGAVAFSYAKPSKKAHKALPKVDLLALVKGKEARRVQDEVDRNLTFPSWQRIIPAYMTMEYDGGATFDPGQMLQVSKFIMAVNSGQHKTSQMHMTLGSKSTPARFEAMVGEWDAVVTVMPTSFQIENPGEHPYLQDRWGYKPFSDMKAPKTTKTKKKRKVKK